MNRPESPDRRSTACTEGKVRYAVYYAPDVDSDWWLFGNRWLGRDPLAGTPLDQPDLPGVAPQRLADLTADARRYGLHATLKPPFRLAPDSDLTQLDASIVRLAAMQRPFALGRIEVGMLGHFIALQLKDMPHELVDLASDCVQLLDAFRRAAPESEIARRRSAGLTATQDELLQRWGYPYVLSEWRFHMTLTGPVGRSEAVELLAWLRPHVERLNWTPLVVDGLCLFEETFPGAPFRLRRRYGFDGSVIDFGLGAPVTDLR